MVQHERGVAWTGERGQTLDAALEKCVPPKKKHLPEPNKRALQMGIDL